ncbi:MAG: DUF1015 domain-containing protein [Candidatus Omnitrophota bacterium]
MTQIKPFKAICYDPEKVGDLSRVVCPPYDVISPEQQNRYHAASPYNFIHVLLGKDKPKDDEHENKYIRAQKIFEQWLKEGILKEDEKAGIYFYRQEYKVLGQRHSRFGFIALMRLQDESQSKVYPHENTHAKAIEDRYRLWTNLKANLSSIFVCFLDQEKRVLNVFNKHVTASAPFIDLVDDDHVRHIVWRVVDPDLIQEMEDALENQQLFIADGHHRYEVAQQYRRAKLKNKPKTDEPASFNYVMTYFTNMGSKDLQIFPIHRVIPKMPVSLEFLEKCFRIDKIKLKGDLVVLLAKAGKNEHAFGLYTREGIRLLRLKNKLLIDEYISEGSSEYKRLDATILKYFVLDHMGIKSDDIIYEKDFQAATDMVDNGLADACFIMNPVKIEQISAIALNGERMPPKTTYFYPKVLSGLTINRID